MTVVFVSHPRQQAGPVLRPARARLRSRVRRRRGYNPEARELTPAELADAARGCDALIAYRQTPAPRALFAALPQLAAFMRCAVDIRTVDVAAASEHGVLVTQASAGFVAGRVRVDRSAR